MLAVCGVLPVDGIAGVALIKLSVDVLPGGNAGPFFQFAGATETCSFVLVLGWSRTVRQGGSCAVP